MSWLSQKEALLKKQLPLVLVDPLVIVLQEGERLRAFGVEGHPDFQLVLPAEAHRIARGQRGKGLPLEAFAHHKQIVGRDFQRHRQQPSWEKLWGKTKTQARNKLAFFLERKTRLHLGKVALYQMSYSRIFNFLPLSFSARLL